MTSTSLLARPFLVLAAAACIASSAAVAAARSTIQPHDREASLRLFHQRIDDYTALHRRLEAPLPPLTISGQTLGNTVARQLLADAIRKARTGVPQGSIFSPDVAAVFRDIIAGALEGRSVEGFLSDLLWEHPEIHHVSPAVNEPLPDGATHEMPVVLIMVLPVLPPDIEYRIVNHDLVLWDVDADLVIDYVPAAFGPEVTTTLE